jgi:hypothetical protein
MKLDKLVKRGGKFSRPYCVSRGEGFRLKDVDPADIADLASEDKPRAKEMLC